MDEYEEILASKRVIRVLGIVAECEEITNNRSHKKSRRRSCGRL